MIIGYPQNAGMTTRLLRVAAYAVCTRGDDVLMARYLPPVGGPYWTLPGGKVEHAEDPYRAVIREVAEETGYQVRVERLLGVDSRVRLTVWGRPDTEQHSIGVFYRVKITGGELSNEVDGSTDLAQWIPRAEIHKLERAQLVDTALELDRLEPVTGHVEGRPDSALLHR